MTEDRLTDSCLVKKMSNEILEVKCRALSDLVINQSEAEPSRKAFSEIELSTKVNYNELCGLTKYVDNPVWPTKSEVLKPTCCLWKYITQENATYLRNHQGNKKIILEFIEKNFVSEKIHKGNNARIIVRILWETFKFARYNFNAKGQDWWNMMRITQTGFREKCVSDKVLSAILGVVYLTHLFFMSHPWRTTDSMYEFFRQTVLLHTVLDVYESSEILTIPQCELFFEFFRMMYLENLPLLRIACHPNYHFTMTLCNISLADNNKVLET